MSIRIGSAIFAGMVFSTPPPLGASAADVDLQLVLAADVSHSMSRDERRLQRDGYVAAFRHPELTRAILSGEHGKIAVTYVEWAGSAEQSIIVPWTILSDATSAGEFASRIASARQEVAALERRSQAGSCSPLDSSLSAA